MNEMFAWTKPGEVADAQMASDALTFVIKTYARTFQEQMSSYPEAQKQLLIAIAKDGQAQQVTSVAFCKKHSMKSPSTVQSALRVLHDKGIVRKDGTTYSVTNRLFGIWLAMAY